MQQPAQSDEEAENLLQFRFMEAPGALIANNLFNHFS